VGVADWTNPGRTFDAVKLHYVGECFGDTFAGNVVVPYAGHLTRATAMTVQRHLRLQRQIAACRSRSLFSFAQRRRPCRECFGDGRAGTPTTARDIYTLGFGQIPARQTVRLDYGSKPPDNWQYLQFDSEKAAGSAGLRDFASAGYTWKMSGPRRVWVSATKAVPATAIPRTVKVKLLTTCLVHSLLLRQMNLFCERNMHIRVFPRP